MDHMNDVAGGGHKACPFCGSRNLTVKPVWQRYRFVACNDCKGAGPVAKDADEAWRLFDHREEPMPPQARLFG